MKTIVTHTSPDFDAIAYVWLIATYAPGFNDYQVEFMPFNAVDHQMLDSADSVGDIGGIYDSERLRFDHHHLPGAESTSTCAAQMAWGWLLNQGIKLGYLAPLIEEIYRGDLADTPPTGIHTLLFGWKQKAKESGRILTDFEILEYGIDILENVACWLKYKTNQTKELESKVVWKSEDNLIWAIQGGSTSVSFAAYGEGARIVVFEGEPLPSGQEFTYPAGATRAPEWSTPHLGELVDEILSDLDHTETDIADELEKWFQHPAGFFAGRGTAKAPDPSPLRSNIVELAKLLDKAWKR